MEPRIRIETESDQAAIRDVHVTAFSAEADLVEELRGDGHVRLSLVAEINRGLVGHILFSAMSLKGENGVVDALALAPLAVRPE